MVSPRLVCRIGPLSLDAKNEVLLRDGVPLPLGRRAVSLLKRLVEAPGEIVGKDALYEAAWSGQAVEESNLTVQMSLLRRTLRAEVAEGGGWIETLARRGYRFVGPVAWQAAPLSSADRAEPSLPLLAVTAMPPAAFDISNIPFATPLHFTGRAVELDAIHAVLTDGAHQPAIVVLHGLRGVGKTVLAAAYARQRAANYRVTWWLRAETVVTLRADIAALAIRLGWARSDSAEDTAFAAALDGLQQHGEQILLIYDNATDAGTVRPYLPKSGAASIVITSNAPSWRAYATPLELGVWSAAIGADYLIARTGQSANHDDAKKLSEALGGLPLAHEQAASYIECLEVSVSAYLSRFDASPIRLLDHNTYAPADYHNGLTVARAFRLAIEQASVLHPAVQRLLQCAAVLAPEPIPVFLFREGREALSEPLKTQLAGDGLDEALAVLRGFALIGRAAIPDERDAALRTDCLRLHRLVRQVVVETLPPESIARVRAEMIGALAAVYPKVLFNVPSTWPRVRRLDALALPLVAPPAIIPNGAEMAACLVLDGLASFRHGALAAFGQARILFERELDLAEATFGPVHPVTGLALNNLALLLRDYGDPEAARPLYVRALAVREATLGIDHPDTAVCLNNLANVLLELKNPSAAHALFDRALRIWQVTHGAAHWQTARGMNNLARSLHLLGDLDRSRALHGQALTLRETTLGPDHPDTSNSLKNIALLQLDLGDVAEARALGERALRINDAFFGPDHPETASTRATLASIVLAQGDPATALRAAENALAALGSSLAPGAPKLRMAAEVTADCLDALGRAAEAAALRRAHIPAPAMIRE